MKGGRNVGQIAEGTALPRTINRRSLANAREKLLKAPARCPFTSPSSVSCGAGMCRKRASGSRAVSFPGKGRCPAPHLIPSFSARARNECHRRLGGTLKASNRMNRRAFGAPKPREGGIAEDAEMIQKARPEVL